MSGVKLFLILSLFSLISGQIIRIQISNSGAITPTDVFVFLTVASYFLSLFFKKTKFKFSPTIFLPFSFFTLIATSSTILALNFYTAGEILTSSLFLIRFVVYFLLVFVVANTVIDRENWLKLFFTIGIIFTAAGFLQLTFLPDFTQFVIYGWDPHQSRLLSSLLDPNYTGLVITTFAIFSVCYFLYTKKKIYLFLAAIFSLGLLLTFSRSSYLSFIFAISTVSFSRSGKLILVVIALFLITFSTVGQFRERVIGALTFDETSQSRVESWQKAVEITKKNPLLGVGFNTYRLAQSKYGYFETTDSLGGHSGSGSDSSLLLVAATTGILGLSAYIALLTALLVKLWKNHSKNAINLATFATFVGALIHSQFVNSLFFPQIMLVLWFVVGIRLKSRDN